ncbi:glycoside hydrolase family protein [Cohnella cholangitidis]|uniref:Uncharacterized protein n=1 Tax=Cohnella cholangitidis TaxID=2598458 RepID=A0A7G5C5J1_9BACL|nr:hypothetical protein [Cohnella cholangitidis]QMV44475.1 hypothetical protein FPL14_27375 [Cohnella cholangitidis]
MANRYANLVGANNISAEYQKITDGFQAVQDDVDGKAPASVGTDLTAHIGSRGSSHGNATTSEAGFISAADKTKLNGIEAEAQKNKPGFSHVNDVAADIPEDTLTVEGGTGITVTTNPTTKKMTITATGTATPGAHGSSHNPDGADPIPALDQVIDDVAAHKADGVTHLVAFNGNGNLKGQMASSYAIGLAATRDKKHYIVQQDIAFEPTGVNGDFDRNNVKDPCIISVGDMIYMWYSGHSNESSNVYRIGLATLDLKKTSLGNKKSNWVRHPSYPLNFGLNNYQLSPNVLYEPEDTGREFKMWFAGGTSGFAGLEIYYAYSSNGISWTLHGKVVSLGSSGAWDDNFIQPTHITKIGSTYHLFYAGFKTGERQKTGYVTFSNPEGVYTKSPDNPIMTRKNQSQALTANATTGSKTVKVASTSAFAAGATIVIADESNTNNFEFNTIQTIVNSTDILLDQPLLRGYTTVAGSTILGLENGSLNIFHLDFEDGVYTAYGTAFQLGNVGTTIGGYLLETTFIAQGPSLNALQVVQNRSPFLGMARSATEYKWDFRSRENPRFLKLDGIIKAHDIVDYYPDPATSSPRKQIIPLANFGQAGLAVSSTSWGTYAYSTFPGKDAFPPGATFTFKFVAGIASGSGNVRVVIGSTDTGVQNVATTGTNLFSKAMTMSSIGNGPLLMSLTAHVTSGSGTLTIYDAYIEVNW